MAQGVACWARGWGAGRFPVAVELPGMTGRASQWFRGPPTHPPTHQPTNQLTAVSQAAERIAGHQRSTPSTRHRFLALTSVLSSYSDFLCSPWPLQLVSRASFRRVAKVAACLAGERKEGGRRAASVGRGAGEARDVRTQSRCPHVKNAVVYRVE